MDQRDGEVRVDLVPQRAERRLRVLHGEAGRSPDEGVHEVGLPSPVQLLAHPAVDLLLVSLPGEVRDHGPAAPRHGADRGHVQVAEGRQREGARDRRGRHQQQVGGFPLAHDRGALRDAEPVLLVHDHEPQAAEGDIGREQGVRAEQQVDLAPRERRTAAGRAPRRSRLRRGTRCARPAARAAGPRSPRAAGRGARWARRRRPAPRRRSRAGRRAGPRGSCRSPRPPAGAGPSASPSRGRPRSPRGPSAGPA